MTLPSVKVSNRYQIAVPQLARKRLKIKSGDRLLVDVQDGMIVLLPEPENYTQALAGLHREIWEKSGDYMIGERSAWTDSSKS
ncbi:MAG TPA: AbrB/MazE/SpoVT family DNA-binding domain-containing protein [Anaerolineales bacterium]|nr:AbrB/MazE/SpoVT family DNA-binding domain-containing protein [Anaerolineales bacterium]